MISNACWSWVKSRVHEDVPFNNDVIMSWSSMQINFITNSFSFQIKQKSYMQKELYASLHLVLPAGWLDLACNPVS